MTEVLLKGYTVFRSLPFLPFLLSSHPKSVLVVHKRMRERSSPSEFLGNRLHLHACVAFLGRRRWCRWKRWGQSPVLPVSSATEDSCFFMHGRTGNSNIQHLVIWQPIWFGCGFTTMMVHVCVLSDLLTCYQDEEEEKKPAEKACCVATVPPIFMRDLFEMYVLAFKHDCLLAFMSKHGPAHQWYPVFSPGGRRQIAGPWAFHSM